MRARRLTTVGLATLAAAALAAAPAGARLVRPVSSFTPTGLESPAAVAVDQATGDVYVTGSASGNVERFSATGVREEAFVSPAFELPEGVAVDNSGGASKGDVYVADFLGEKVLKLDSSGKEAAGFTPIVASSIPEGDPGHTELKPHGVAVDPANGDVVVTDLANREVDIFSSAGAFLLQFAAPGVEAAAVGSSSEIFTADFKGVQEWSPPTYSTPTPIGPETPAFGIAVDLLTGNVLADEGKLRYIGEYEPSGALLLQFGSGLLESSIGVAVHEATDSVYATAPESGLVYIFGAPGDLAAAVTGAPATGVTGTTASVSGTVNPEGTTVTGCRFEYGLSTAYGSSSACSEPPPLPLTGNTAIPVAGSLSVQPDETYHYRLVAVNASGPAYGEDETFQTPALAPSLDGESVSALTQTAVTLNARINPNNQDTTYHFQFGATTAYGTVLPALDADIGSGYGDVVVGQQLTGLTPGTTYHFRVIATNATSPPGGTAAADQTFTTPPPQPPVVGTGQAQGVAQNTATLTATIDTQGFETTYEFDLGTDTSYGSRIFGDAGPEPGQQTFTFALQGLAPGTTYHYRIAATNIFGTAYGADVTFTTGAYPSSTLSTPLAPALLPAILLAPATSASTAKVASRRPTAGAARHSRAARKSGGKRRPGRHTRKGRSRGVGRAHGAPTTEGG
ncbi:MAG: hypothetical protein ACRDLF_13310 [Solirubrobacteraceae bacterium]